MSLNDWTAVPAWNVPEGITMRRYEITYLNANGFWTTMLDAPSLNLALRRFVFLKMGDLSQVREVARPKADA